MLVADGLGLKDHTINDGFAKLAQALYMADREARKAVEARNNLWKKVATKEHECTGTVEPGVEDGCVFVQCCTVQEQPQSEVNPSGSSYITSA